MPMPTHHADGNTGPAMEMIRLGGLLKGAQTVMEIAEINVLPRLWSL